MSLTIDAPQTISAQSDPIDVTSTSAACSATAADPRTATAFDRIRPVHPARNIAIVPLPAQPRTAPTAPEARVEPTRGTGAPKLPEGTEARGFALYVGFDAEKAAAAGTSLGTVVQALKKALSELAPGSESYASIALAPQGAGGRDVDVVRLALHDPAAVARHRGVDESAPSSDQTGVVIDITRKRLTLDGEPVALTYKEFELLQYLVLREGRTIERPELIDSLWIASDDDDVPNERTIDVHVRRLRAKLARYEDIVRTVRGIGYRFDRHADVVIRHSHAPSPDLF